MLIEFMAAELRRGLKAVSHAMSPDPTRRHLASVFLTREPHEGDRWVAVATDGHWLARWAFPESSVKTTKESAGPANVLICRDDVRRLLTMLGAKPHGEAAVWTKNRGARYGGQRIKFEKNEATFPQYMTIFPKLGVHDGFSAIGLGGAVLTKASRAFLDGRRKPFRGTNTMTFAFHQNEVDPIVVTSDSLPELTCVVMPCRVNITKRLRPPVIAA